MNNSDNTTNPSYPIYHHQISAETKIPHEKNPSKKICSFPQLNLILKESFIPKLEV